MYTHHNTVSIPKADMSPKQCNTSSNSKLMYQNNAVSHVSLGRKQRENAMQARSSQGSVTEQLSSVDTKWSQVWLPVDTSAVALSPLLQPTVDQTRESDADMHSPVQTSS